MCLSVRKCVKINMCFNRKIDHFSQDSGRKKTSGRGTERFFWKKSEAFLGYLVVPQAPLILIWVCKIARPALGISTEAFRWQCHGGGGGEEKEEEELGCRQCHLKYI